MVGPRRSQRPAECGPKCSWTPDGDARRGQLTHQRHDSGQLALCRRHAGMSGGGRRRHPRRRGLGDPGGLVGEPDERLGGLQFAVLRGQPLQLQPQLAGGGAAELASHVASAGRDEVPHGTPDLWQCLLGRAFQHPAERLARVGREKALAGAHRGAE